MGLKSRLGEVLGCNKGRDAGAREEFFPQPNPLEVEQTFEREFKACRDLLALAWERKPRDPAPAFGYLLLAIFARSTLTYRAIMQLCRGGYGEQADMLNRSIRRHGRGALGLAASGRRDRAH